MQGRFGSRLGGTSSLTVEVVVVNAPNPATSYHHGEAQLPLPGSGTRRSRTSL